MNSKNVTGNDPKKVAERVAAHREKYARLDVSIQVHTADTIDELAEQFGTSRALVVRSLLRFALTNRNWKTQGLLWSDGGI